MRTFWILWKREVATYFRTPRATILLFFFLLLVGFNFCAGVNALNHGPTEVSIVEAFFNTIFFWISFLLLIPLLTMHLFADEYRMGTIETLVTAPVRDVQIVLAKFFSAFLLFMILWAPTAFYFILFWPSAHQIAAASHGSYAGAYGMLLLLGMFYLSLGCLTSAMTSHQLVAGMISCSIMVLMFFVGPALIFHSHLLWKPGSPMNAALDSNCDLSGICSYSPASKFVSALPHQTSQLPRHDVYEISGLVTFLHSNSSSLLHAFVQFFSPMEHMTNFSRGLIDTRPIVWYLSMTIFVLFLTWQVFQFRNRKNR